MVERLVGCSWGMTQADGKVIQGELDSKSFLGKVIAGREHKVQLHPWFEPKKQLSASRIELKSVLNEILNVERLEADRLKAIQEQRSDAANAFYSGAALGKGGLYGAWGLVKSVAEFSDLINPFDALSNAAVSAWSAEVLPAGSCSIPLSSNILLLSTVNWQKCWVLIPLQSVAKRGSDKDHGPTHAQT